MGFVKTPAEIAAIEAVVREPRFVNSEMLSIVAGTDPAWLAEVIPAPLQPDGDSVRFMVGRWQSNCVGNFSGGAVYLPAKFTADDGTVVTGEYVLTMFMDVDAAILYGREVFGEPKKQSEVELNRGANHAVGILRRGGVEIVKLEGTFTTDHGPSHTSGGNFNIKAQPDASGAGLEFDAVLTLAEFEVDLTAHRSGTGTVKLGSTAHDPLDSIPIREVRESIWQEGDLIPLTRKLATIPAADFVPYFYGRVDNYALLNTE